MIGVSEQRQLLMVFGTYTVVVIIISNSDTSMCPLSGRVTCTRARFLNT